MFVRWSEDSLRLFWEGDTGAALLWGLQRSPSTHLPQLMLFISAISVTHNSFIYKDFEIVILSLSGSGAALETVLAWL